MFASPREIVSVVNKQYVHVATCDRRLYVGLTSDLVGRLQQHNDGKVPCTKARGPFELIYWEGRSDAAQREKYLKSAPILENETQELSHGVKPTSPSPSEITLEGMRGATGYFSKFWTKFVSKVRTERVLSAGCH